MLAADFEPRVSTGVPPFRWIRAAPYRRGVGDNTLPGRTPVPGRWTRPGLAGLVPIVVSLLVGSPGLADGRIPFLSERLKYPPPAGQTDDFRVRTNAALALGATNADDATAPLCSGLADPSDVVREAVAVALKRLARIASLECLRNRFSVESSGPVKQQIQRALEAIDRTRRAEPVAAGPEVANPRYYVSLSRIVNHTSRDPGDVERIVQGAIASKLAQVGGYELAPTGETSEAARTALMQRRLKGYYLSVSVDRFEYSNEGLRVHVTIAVFSYPGRDLRGEVPAGATLPGARPGDMGAEDQLMGVVAARAAELFAKNFQ